MSGPGLVSDKLQFVDITGRRLNQESRNDTSVTLDKQLRDSDTEVGLITPFSLWEKGRGRGL